MNRINTTAFRFAAALFVLCVCFAAATSAQTPEKAPPLPAGMTGSDAKDPRAKLSPGLYDAGEAAMGIKHLMLLKKPDAFQLGSDDPDSPNVKKMLGLLGMSDTSQMPKPVAISLCPARFCQFGSGISGQPPVYGKFLRC